MVQEPRNRQFGPFILDVLRGCVRRGNDEIAFRPKAFEVLQHLVQNAGRLVSKEELHEAVWPKVTVTDDSLVQCIRELRDKLGDHDHSLIKTVPRRGYLLEVATSVVTAAPAAADAPIAEPPTALPRKRPRLAIAAMIAAAATSLVGIMIAIQQIWAPGHQAAVATITNAHEPAVFRDCAACPEMVALPAGNFLMGSPTDELGRTRPEGLPRRVDISKPFAIGRYEVTVAQFETFVAETDLAISNNCRLISKIDGDTVGWSEPKASFRQPSYQLSGDHPVGCMSLHQAEAFVGWLRRRTGKPYRLPTEAEWEYAARAGTSSAFSFGDETERLCDYARFADLATPFAWKNSCRLENAAYGPMKVGSLKPNPWGLFDMHGNVWEWVEDCWTTNPEELPTDGSALMRNDGCEVGVLRGGSWASGPIRLRSAMRLRQRTQLQDENMGFRVALTLPTPAPVGHK